MRLMQPETEVFRAVGKISTAAFAARCKLTGGNRVATRPWRLVTPQEPGSQVQTSGTLRQDPRGRGAQSRSERDGLRSPRHLRCARFLPRLDGRNATKG